MHRWNMRLSKNMFQIQINQQETPKEILSAQEKDWHQEKERSISFQAKI